MKRAYYIPVKKEKQAMAVNDFLVGGGADDVWVQRWAALSFAIDALFNAYGQVPNTPRLKTLRPLLLCLQAFAGKRFADFHSGFLAQRLETWPDFPPDAVLSVIQDQIGFDIGVIDRAILQRLCGTSLMKESLARADQLAWSALQLAVSAGLLPKKLPTVVTYFQKSPDIRVIPYAPVALVGIPYSCQQLARDLLATPHEVGHYVFSHGSYLGQSLRSYLRDQLGQIVQDQESRDYRRLLRWLEETFADVYGACVAGPVMALDFQDLQLHTGRERFITDDNDHPVPVLRPWIHLQVLRKRDPGGWAAWADVLQRNWEVRLEERERIDQTANPTRNLDHFVSDGEPVAVANTISEFARGAENVRPLDRLVTFMLDVLSVGNTQPWYGNLPEVTTAEPQLLQRDALTQATEPLYRALDDFVGNYPPVVEPDKLDPLLNAALNTPAEKDEIVAQWLDAKLLEFPTDDIVPHEKWEPYFFSDGWTTEGPQNFWP
jgi:hypothetical protein